MIALLAITIALFTILCIMRNYINLQCLCNISDIEVTAQRDLAAKDCPNESIYNFHLMHAELVIRVHARKNFVYQKQNNTSASAAVLKPSKQP